MPPPPRSDQIRVDPTQIWSERTLGGTGEQEEVLVEDASTSSDEEEDTVTLKERYAVMSRYKSASTVGSSKRAAEDSDADVPLKDRDGDQRGGE